MLNKIKILIGTAAEVEHKYAEFMHGSQVHNMDSHLDVPVPSYRRSPRLTFPPTTCVDRYGDDSVIVMTLFYEEPLL